MSEYWRAATNRVTNDPDRIEKRKRIAPAFTVPRIRHNFLDADGSAVNGTVTYLPAPALAEMEADEDQRVPADHAIKAKKLRERFMT